MLEHESYVALFNFGFFIVCVISMGMGVFFAREAPNSQILVSRFNIVTPIYAVLWVAAVAVGHYYGNAFQAFLYCGCLGGCFGFGIALEIWESQSNTIGGSIRDVAVESARQWGKLPTSH